MCEKNNSTIASPPLSSAHLGLAAAGLATLAAATGKRSAGPVVACQGAAMAAVMLGALFPAFRLYDQLQLAPVRALARPPPGMVRKCCLSRIAVLKQVCNGQKPGCQEAGCDYAGC